jgi:hypothetical protein
VVIQDNTLDAIGSGSVDGQVGITLYNGNATTGVNCGVHNAAITGNTITTGGSDSLGIWAYGYNTGIGITGNEITDLGKGLLVEPVAGTPVGFVVSGNDIVGNTVYGVSNAGTGTLDARYNWWGDNSGPYHATLNVGGTGDAVSDNVDFQPWTSQTTPTTGGTASFTPDAGTITGLTGVPTPPNPPATLPHGMFSFTVTGLTSGQTVTITVELPGSVPVGTKWWKYQGGSWYWLPIGDDDGDNIITITLTDETPTSTGVGDEDSTAGSIQDDGGAGGAAVGWETHPISKVRVFLPWIALLAAIAAGASLLVARRRRTTT